MTHSSLRAMLARVGEEKARERVEKAGPPADGNYLRRAQECLDLYEQLVPLRFSRLVADLGSEQAARDAMRAEAKRQEREQEGALLRIQERLYGSDRDETKA